MKKYYIILGLALLVSGAAVAENLTTPKKPGKHKTHKRTKKKKSSYFYNFQH